MAHKEIAGASPTLRLTSAQTAFTVGGAMLAQHARIPVCRTGTLARVYQGSAIAPADQHVKHVAVGCVIQLAIAIAVQFQYLDKLPIWFHSFFLTWTADCLRRAPPGTTSSLTRTRTPSSTDATARYVIGAAGSFARRPRFRGHCRVRSTRSFQAADAPLGFAASEFCSNRFVASLRR